MICSSEEQLQIHFLGFSKDSYRRDELCGFHLQNTGGLFFWGFDASSWCRPDSPKPCCTNALKGICVSELNCPKKGVNLANYLHAELSDWVPNDERFVLHSFFNCIVYFIVEIIIDQLL